MFNYPILVDDLNLGGGRPQTCHLPGRNRARIVVRQSQKIAPWVHNLQPIFDGGGIVRNQPLSEINSPFVNAPGNQGERLPAQ